MNKLIPFFILFFALNVFSQKQANIWYFGENAGLNFNSSPPVALTDGLLNTLEGCSTFSDANGDLLFYSDGITVFDKNHATMTYTDDTLADNLLGNPSATQSGMIIPKPLSTSIYYLFTVTDNRNSNGFNVYTIDMSLKGGNGQLIDEDGDGLFFDKLQDGSWTEKVAAVKGENCNTFWVITAFNNNFYSYLVDSDGVQSTPVISSVSTPIDQRGYLKISPDGKKIALANQTQDKAVLYDFNNLTGEINNNETFVIENFSGDGEPYGVEFSIDSKKLYISTVSGFRYGLSGWEYENYIDNPGFNNPVTYKLFQFDLTATNIPDSKSLIHIQEANSSDYPEGGYRGALQLGPDGKIYAIIPLAYEDPASFAPFLDVIENPTADARDIIFTKDAINLNGKFATQGLPPFISSLLLPISISDDSGLPSNNMDLKTCIGSSKVITPENIDDISNLNYIWTFEIGTLVTEISNSPTQKSLNLLDIQLTNTGTYKLKIEGNDDCGNSIQYDATFNLEVYEGARALEPDPIYFCDSDATIPNIFDLRKSELSDKSKEILDGLNDTIFEVLYFDDEVKAFDNVAGTNLPDNYQVNTPGSQIIYARVHNKKAPNTCYATTDFNITVTGLPVASDPGPYRECDTDIAGPNLGYHDTFLLKNKDNDILGSTSGLDPTLYNISYHTTPTGAQQDNATDAIPKNVLYRNSRINSQLIYVRLENIADPNCFDASMSFNLIVDPLPIPKENPTELKQCDTDPDKKTTFNLTLVEKNISDNPTDTFEYYTTESDAITGTPGALQVADKTSYPVDTSGEAWVRIISEFTCYTISKIELTVSYTPNELYDETFRECDDLFPADGITGLNNDKDGITFFDLSSTPDKISSDLDIVVELYETEEDRTKSSDEIRKRFSDLSKYRNNKIPNTTGNKFPIFYKRISKSNNDCQGIGQFYLQIQSVPIANTPANFDLCDDDLSGNTTDGINNGINLREKSFLDSILGSTQTETNFDVTFHESSPDAKDITSLGISEIDAMNYSNILQAGFKLGDISEQTIFVRVQDKDPNTRCVSSITSFKIIVNPIPSISNTINPFPVCDIVTSSDGDPRNRIAQNIDLTSKNNEILAGKTNHRVAYYLTQPDAENNIEIVNPTNFQNISALTSFPTDFNTDDPAIQTIFVKVFDLGGNKCSSVFSTFKVVIYPEPNIPLNISNYSDCDNMTDSDADDANGINGNIALKNKIPEILANYDPAKFADFAVRFYASLTAAEIGDPTNALNENTFENSINGQEIFVRVENIKNTPIICVNTRLSFNININPLPDFTVMGEENIEDPLIVCLNDTPLVLEVENPLATYTYQWTNQAGDLLGNDPTQNVYLAGKYAVTASESATGCSRERTIVVEESDIATLEQSFINIIDEGNNIGSEDKSSISIDTISNDLGPGDYQFAILNTDNGNRTPFVGFQDEPLFENLEGGIYTIIVNDKNGCVPDATLQVSVLQFPKFFTPNGDGRNDTYRVKGANKTFYPNSSINIFNRYGKLVAQIPIDSQGWNGTYNGKKLSSDDYWYNITLIPADNTKQIINKTGNFSLLRK